MKILTKFQEDKLREDIYYEIKVEQEKLYREKLSKMKEEILYGAIGKLNDLGGQNLNLGIKVETDDVRHIKLMLGEMQNIATKTLLEEAKKHLLSFF